MNDEEELHERHAVRNVCLACGLPWPCPTALRTPPGERTLSGRIQEELSDDDAPGEREEEKYRWRSLSPSDPRYSAPGEREEES